LFDYEIRWLIYIYIYNIFLFQENSDNFAGVARSFELKQLDDANKTIKNGLLCNKDGENDVKAWKSKAELYQVLNPWRKIQKQHSKTNISL
jgi:hypothetical protein